MHPANDPIPTPPPVTDEELVILYLADELDADARSAFAQRLAEEPALQAQCDAFAALTDALPAALHQDASTGLAENQRDRILIAARERPRLRMLWRGGAAAAVLILAVGVYQRTFGADRDASDEASRFTVMHAVDPSADPQWDGEGTIVNLDNSTDGLEDSSSAARDSATAPSAGSGSSAPAQPEFETAFEGSGSTFSTSAAGGASPATTPRLKPVINPAVAPAPPSGPVSNGTIGVGGGSPGHLRLGGALEMRLEGPVGRVRLPAGAAGGEGYDALDANPFRDVRREHTSTFSIDVDTASYANVRRMLLREGRLPPAAAVRAEEFLNYFRYDYAAPEGASVHPFHTGVRITTCPWNPRHRLARVAIQGRQDTQAGTRARNIVFLIDVSGSMRSEDKLPLLKSSLHLMSERLTERDRVAIVTYAGNAGLLLPSTKMDALGRQTLRRALAGLGAGGSTNGAQGIRLAYAQAAEHFIEEGVNRVMLCTDGDFNVGVTSKDELHGLLEGHADKGIFLSVLGFGTGNYQDGRMEDLSNRGNGNYAYIDSLLEARKALVEGLDGTLVTIAKDVKIQVFFNPKRVAAWRLVGYVNRQLAARDFNDDKKDAGEIGAGHQVTALYELVPHGTAMPNAVSVDPNPFVKQPDVEIEEDRDPAFDADASKASFRLRLRYKQPTGTTSQLIERDIVDAGETFEKADNDMHFATAVAAFAMRLRGESAVTEVGYDAILEWATPAIGKDPGGYRAEFLTLIKKAKSLTR